MPPEAQTTQVEPKKTLTDADVVSGGPLDPKAPEYEGGPGQGDDAGPAGGGEAPAAGAAAPAATTAPAASAQAPAGATAAGAPIIVNGRTFRDAAELAAYTSQIEGKILNPMQGKPAEEIELIDGKPLDEVMFNDPKRYHQYVVDKATKQAQASFDARAQEKANADRFWQDFYSKNPDLKDLDWVVQSKFRESFVELEKLPLATAMERLAKDSRSVVDTIRQKSGVKTTEMPSGGSSSLGASSGSAPRQAKPEPQLNFVEQVKAARKQRA